jgi:hypothetical protein
MTALNWRTEEQYSAIRDAIKAGAEQADATLRTPAGEFNLRLAENMLFILTPLNGQREQLMPELDKVRNILGARATVTYMQ